MQDKAPQLGAALAYYTVFWLAPLILVLLAIVGVIFRDDPAGAWSKITEQMSYFLNRSAVQVVQNIAQKASQPGKSAIATVIGVALALFGASGVFGQLQDAFGKMIVGVKAKPGLWYLGLPTQPVSVICDGRRRLFSPSRFANPRKPAQRLQPLCAICFARWPCGRDEHLSYLRVCSHCSALRHDF